ncbi:MAG: porin family protein [bacterium]|nr:porin family protein [bacterium]
MRALVILGLVAMAVSASAQSPSSDPIEPLPDGQSSRPGSDVVLEIGLAMPTGDLTDDFDTSELGFGAGNGFELGFRWRLHLGDRFSVSPSFHFTDYDDFDGFYLEESETKSELVAAAGKTSVYSFGLEARYALGEPGSFWRPFAAVGAGLDRNRLHGWRKEFTEAVDLSVNSLGLNARLGVRLDQFELSAVYRYSRFSTRRFFESDESPDYVWDAVVVRAGWVMSL